MFYNFGSLETQDLMLYSLIIFLGIYGYTSLMDKSPFAYIPNLLFVGSGLYVLLTTEDWFGIKAYSSNWITVVLIYFAITSLGVLYFSLLKKPTPQVASLEQS